MSGFEIAGVVLGAIPLLVEAIQEYKAGRSAASNFVRWRGLLDQLLDRLRFQHVDFHLSIRNLLQAAGIEAAYNDNDACRKALDSPENQSLLEEHLGPALAPFDQTVRNREVYLRQLAGKLSGVRRVPGAEKDDLRAILNAPKEPPGKSALSRRIKFTMEKEALNCLIKNLDEESVALDKLVDKSRIYANYATSSPGMAAKTMVRKFRKLQKAAHLLTGAIESAYTGLGCHPEHRVMLGLTARVDGVQDYHAEPVSHTKLAEDTLFNIWFRAPEIQGHCWCCATIRAAWSEAVDDPAPASTALLPSQTPWINVMPVVPTVSVNVIRNICDTIQNATSNQRCLSLCIKSKTLHLSTMAGISKPDLEIYEKNVTLQEFLDNTMGQVSLQLSIPDRMRIALALASSVLQFQSTPWLHPIWNDTKISFLSRSHDWKDIDPKRPIVPYTVSTSSIQNRQLLNTKPKEVMLELAIILLELYHHQSFDQWAMSAGQVTGPTDGQRRSSAIQWLESTENMIIESYAAAIGRCLEICANPIHKWEDATLQETFCENIILQLKKMCK